MSLATSPVGSLVPISGYDARFGEDYHADAFVPTDLPDCVDLPGAVWMAISDANAELGRLDAAASLVPNPQLVTRIATRREAVGTSALEGTYAELTELYAAEVLPFDEQDTEVAPNVREVMNYARAADAAYGWIGERPITLQMLASLQAEIVRGTESDSQEAGAIRESQVFIGAKHRRVTEARFIPPPPGDQLRAMCERWVEWLSAPAPLAQIQLIPRIAMAHYQFETLHPFIDGNGRVGRLVAILQLMSEHALRSPVLSVSPWLKDRADEYRDHLLAVSMTGDWAPWVEFFANAVAVEARSGHERIMRLLELREQLGETVRSALPRARLALEITDDLIAFPILSVSVAQRRYGRSNQANRDAIGSLVELGVLEPYGEARYDRLFWNRRVFQIIEG
ncbi:MAG TPA: Fic/DOC family N-terminal domain-containing protein [Microthrixaceae bacterium]|mgnify:CR=1 FL=1|jgi:Fic family protein|nr:Fic/DOC family N-terminal domain-containing protein [Microthrixaceae bacterium]